MPKSPDPWQELETLSETPATLHEWRGRFGEFYEAVIPFLVPAAVPDDIFVPCAQCARPVLALPGASGFHNVAHDPEDLCSAVATIPSADLGVRTLDVTALGKNVAQLLGFDRPSREDVESIPALLGYTLRPSRLPVFITLQPDAPSYRYVAQALLSRHASPFIFMTGTGRESVRLALRSLGIPVVSAQDYLAWSSAGLARTGRLIETDISLQCSPLAADRRQRYSITCGAGAWLVTFDGETFPVADQKGLLYVAYLLRCPPSEPMHALALATAAEGPADDACATVRDSETGREIALDANATLQQLNISKDDRLRLINLRRRFGGIVHELEDPNTPDVQRPDLEKELSDIDQEIHSIARLTRDAAGKKVDAVRRSITRLCEALRAIPTAESTANVADRFASFIETHITDPSSRFGRSLRSKQAGHAAGCFVYEPPPGVVWS